MPQRKSPTLISTLAINIGILFFATSALGIVLINIQMRKQGEILDSPAIAPQISPKWLNSSIDVSLGARFAL